MIYADRILIYICFSVRKGGEKGSEKAGRVTIFRDKYDISGEESGGLNLEY